MFAPIAPPEDADQIGMTLPAREYPAALPPEEHAPDGPGTNPAAPGAGPSAIPDLGALLPGPADDPAPHPAAD